MFLFWFVISVMVAGVVGQNVVWSFLNDQTPFMSCLGHAYEDELETTVLAAIEERKTLSMLLQLSARPKCTYIDSFRILALSLYALFWLQARRPSYPNIDLERSACFVLSKAPLCLLLRRSSCCAFLSCQHSSIWKCMMMLHIHVVGWALMAARHNLTNHSF